MKKQEENQPPINEKESGKDSNPVNKFKKDQKKSTVNSLENVIDSAATNSREKTGSGLADKGTAVSYEDKV